MFIFTFHSLPTLQSLYPILTKSPPLLHLLPTIGLQFFSFDTPLKTLESNCFTNGHGVLFCSTDKLPRATPKK